MGIRTKFNLGLLLVFLLGFAVAGLLLDRQFIATARQEALQDARIMLSAANAVRSYTSREVAPLVTRGDPNWIAPVVIPSYAAQTNFAGVRVDHPNFTYKEAALNPTNPADRAQDWEADFIHAFRNDTSLIELVGERPTPVGPVLTLARPTTIRDEACLQCHSTPDRAPPRMVEVYGATNGFGWRLGETIGAQLVSVPMSGPLAQARGNLITAMLTLLGVFIGLMIVLNILLHFAIIRPVTRMASTATAVSLGQSGAVPDFEVKGRDEIAALGQAFTRMRRSLDQAVKMLGA